MPSFIPSSPLQLVARLAAQILIYLVCVVVLVPLVIPAIARSLSKLFATGRLVGSFTYARALKWEDNGRENGIESTNPFTNQKAMRVFYETMVMYWGDGEKREGVDERGIEVLRTGEEKSPFENSTFAHLTLNAVPEPVTFSPPSMDHFSSSP